MPYGAYIMENVLFKISYPAEFRTSEGRETDRPSSRHHYKLR